VSQHLGHVVLHVRDLERARAFYVDLLGWRERGPVGPHGLALGTGRAPLELVLQVADLDAVPAGPSLGVAEVGVAVDGDTEDLVALRDRLREAGVAIDGLTDDGLVHTLHVRDPDGIALALYVEAVDEAVWRRRHDLLRVPPAPLER
jgi:catechol 2,3-dioxygenase